MISMPASTVLLAADWTPGMSIATSPTPTAANPVSPRLRMLASTTVAAVW